MKKLLFVALLGSCGCLFASGGKDTASKRVLEKNYDMLLNPGNYTGKDIRDTRKNLKEDNSKFTQVQDFFRYFPSNVLFPDQVRYLEIIRGRGTGAFKDIPLPQHVPNEARDKQILENLWKRSVDNEKFIPFIEKGYKNFRKQYKTKLNFRAIEITQGVTLGAYLKTRKTNPAYALLNKIHSKGHSSKEETGSWNKFFVVGAVGIVGVGAYMLYKYKANSQKSAIDAQEEVQVA